MVFPFDLKAAFRRPHILRRTVAGKVLDQEEEAGRKRGGR